MRMKSKSVSCFRYRSYNWSYKCKKKVLKRVKKVVILIADDLINLIYLASFAKEELYEYTRESF